MILNRDYQYEYRGYKYGTWDENDGDCIKTFHECWKDGKEVKMSREFYNQSPYSLIEYDDFVKFVNTLEVFIQG
jgi:hypothetical protein